MTMTLTPGETTVRLHKAMDAAVGLTPGDIGNVQSLIDVGEWLVAFETLCTQIYDREIRLDPDVVRDLEGLGTALGARREPSVTEPLAAARIAEVSSSVGSSLRR